MMETWMWAVGILAGSSGAGFAYLSNKSDNARKDCDREISLLREKVTDKPDYKYLNENFMKADMITLHVKTIEEKLSTLNEGQKAMSSKLDKALINNKKEE